MAPGARARKRGPGLAGAGPMIPVVAFVLFVLERMRCIVLALATIMLVKIAAVMFLAPLVDIVAAPKVSEAAVVGLP